MQPLGQEALEEIQRAGRGQLEAQDPGPDLAGQQARQGAILNDPSNDANANSHAHAFEQRVSQGTTIKDTTSGQNAASAAHSFEQRVTQEIGTH